MSEKIKYDSSSIKVLKGLEAVRRRPGMFIGGTNANGVYRMFKEVLDNAVDEFQAGHNNQVCVWWFKDSVWVGDAGRGMPVEKHPDEGISTLTVLFTRTHAGGKFDNSAYSTSSGLNGVGIKATNALSEWLEVYTKRKGVWWFQSFKKGVFEKEPVKVSNPPKFLKNAKNMSTVIGFSPDTSIMETKTVNLKRLIGEIEDLSYLCPKLNFKVYNGDKVKEFETSEGIKEFVDEYESTFQKHTFFAKGSAKLDQDKKGKSINVEVALKWLPQEESDLFSYVNASFTSEGGTHADGVRKAAASVLKRYGNMESSDLLSGMCGMLHVRMQDPVYSGQTKEKLTNTEIEKAVGIFVKEHLDVYFKKYPSVANHIIKRAKILANARSKADVAKQALKEVKIVKSGSIKGLPAKLITAPKCTAAERELFIVEGDSAEGSCTDARFAAFQEILPLKGKIPNALTAKSAAKFLSNEEVSNMVTALGTHVGQKQNIKNCRYGKIFILSDGDEDGYHIACLLVAFFAKYVPDIIKHGMLYKIKAPLFVGFYKNERKFGNSIDEVKSKFPKKSNVIISRLKGLGESNAVEVREYAMDKNTRNFVRIKWDANLMEELDKIMGKETAYRKEMLGITLEESE